MKIGLTTKLGILSLLIGSTLPTLGAAAADSQDRVIIKQAQDLANAVNYLLKQSDARTFIVVSGTKLDATAKDMPERVRFTVKNKESKARKAFTMHYYNSTVKTVGMATSIKKHIRALPPTTTFYNNDAALSELPIDLVDTEGKPVTDQNIYHLINA